jgi:hypothetical protein
MINDGKDRGVEFQRSLRDGIRDVSTMLTTKPSEEQSRPSKRLRIENTTPDPQEKGYLNKLKQVTFELTGEHRAYLVGLRDTAM